MENKVLAVIVSLLIGYSIGWVNAHYTVAQECRKLGSFYVGKSVFKCIEVKEKESE